MATKGSMTKIYTYARTMKSKSDYANNMKRLSAQIFGEVRTEAIEFSYPTSDYLGEKASD